jgi:hypothetical protein
LFYFISFVFQLFSFREQQSKQHHSSGENEVKVTKDNENTDNAQTQKNAAHPKVRSAYRILKMSFLINIWVNVVILKA